MTIAAEYRVGDYVNVHGYQDYGNGVITGFRGRIEESSITSEDTDVIVLVYLDSGQGGGGPNGEWRCRVSSLTLVRQGSGSYTRPIKRYGPFKPIPKQLPA
jgi:hypothetical protein